MSRAPTRQTSSPQWRTMKRLSASAGACPNSIFIIVTGARNSTRAPAVASPVSKRTSSMWAASMMVLAQLHMTNRRAPRRGALARVSPLLAGVVLDHLIDLLLHRVQVERGRVLHGRVVDGRLGQVRHPLLDKDVTPELSGVEVVAVAERARQRGF